MFGKLNFEIALLLKRENGLITDQRPKKNPTHDFDLVCLKTYPPPAAPCDPIHHISFVPSAKSLYNRTGDALHQELECAASGGESQRLRWSASRGRQREAGGTQWKRDLAAGEFWERRSTWRGQRRRADGVLSHGDDGCEAALAMVVIGEGSPPASNSGGDHHHHQHSRSIPVSSTFLFLLNTSLTSACAFVITLGFFISSDNAQSIVVADASPPAPKTS
ncbi:hypothetical protein Q3G72_004839 [Acer saccharum]|nr:hypothetical protein Q3G72_004839 [Acer saccharum]